VSRSDDPTDAMTRHPTPDDAEKLLTAVPAADGTTPTDPLARLLGAMRAPATPAERAGAERAVATVASAVGIAPASTAEHRRSRMLTPLSSAKAATVAVALVLGAGTAAAAATGSLPGPAQQAVADTLSHVGVSVPNPNSDGHPSDAAPGDGPGSATGHGPDATGDSMYGLCTAYAHGETTTNPHSKRDDAVAFRNLEQAAAAEGETVAELCDGVTPPSGHRGATPPGGPDVTPAEPGNGHGNAPAGVGEGRPASTPPVSTPHGPPASTPPTSTPPGPPASTPPVSTPHATDRP